MPKLDAKYIGRLPPGAADELKRSLGEYRQLVREGIALTVQVLPGPGCAVSEAQAGVAYDVDQVPELPFEGCNRAPCCGCCYNALIV